MTANGNGNGTKRDHWWRPSAWKVRDMCLFCAGLAWLAWEVVFRDEPRSQFVYIAVLLMLGPAYIQPLVDAISRVWRRD